MTKDEFISKYHKQKVLKFEPPTWEEFLATETDGIWAYWSCGDIMINMCKENKAHGFYHTTNSFIVRNIIGEREEITYEYNEFIDNREEMYYKALDIAQKWFLGDK
jgi:hypothetical protein